MSLETLDVPRHVHKTDGTWKRVENHAELAAAVAEGWLVDPNAGTARYDPYGATVQTIVTAGVSLEVDLIEDADEGPEGDETPDADLAEVEAKDLADSAEESKRRGPGRPKKGT